MSSLCALEFAALGPMARRAATLGWLVLLLPGCPAPGSVNGAKKMPREIPDAPWSVSYHDGSNNGFSCQQDAAGGEVGAAYTPMTPERSSSGTYSGGAAWKGTVSGNQARALWRMIRGLQADKAQHEVNRVMGSGSFKLKTPGGETKFIIRRGGNLQRLDSFLEQLRK